MFIVEAVVGGGGVLECIVLNGVPNVLSNMQMGDRLKEKLVQVWLLDPYSEGIW